MNLSSLLGLAFGTLVLVYSVTTGVQNPHTFLNIHAVIIVVGGTLAATMVCFPLPQLISIFRALTHSFSRDRRNESQQIVDQIVEIAQKTSQGTSLREFIPKIENAFLRESLDLLDQGGLSMTELQEVLSKRIDLANDQLRRESVVFKTIGRFPPAFGLIGTTIGMVTLLQGLGSPRAFQTLGPAMSLALVATFYGLVLANIVLIPIGESLLQKSDNDLLLRRLIADGIILLKSKKHPVLVREFLLSYIPGEERVLAKAS